MLCLLSGAARVTAQIADDTTRWTPEFSMQYRTIQSPAMAPDGQLVAYVVRGPLMAGEQSVYRSQIHLAPADGTMNGQYTQGEHSSRRPAFSPDGRHLAFITTRSGTPHGRMAHGPPRAQTAHGRDAPHPRLV